MTEQELYNYIKFKKYYCCFCANLQKDVIKKGINALRQYNGMICGGIEDMQIRLREIGSLNKVNRS